MSQQLGAGLDIEGIEIVQCRKGFSGSLDVCCNNNDRCVNFTFEMLYLTKIFNLTLFRIFHCRNYSFMTVPNLVLICDSLASLYVSTAVFTRVCRLSICITQEDHVFGRSEFLFVLSTKTSGWVNLLI